MCCRVHFFPVVQTGMQFVGTKTTDTAMGLVIHGFVRSQIHMTAFDTPQTQARCSSSNPKPTRQLTPPPLVALVLLLCCWARCSCCCSHCSHLPCPPPPTECQPELHRLCHSQQKCGVRYQPAIQPLTLLRVPLLRVPLLCIPVWAPGPCPLLLKPLPISQLR